MTQLEHYPFSTSTQPKLKMPVKTKSERVQPTARLTQEGQLAWEGLEMPKWQQEMFRKAYHISTEEFGHFWDHLAQTEKSGDVERADDTKEPYWHIASKNQVERWKEWALLVKEFKRQGLK